jgi:flagellar biosynthesis protein FlhF
MRLKSFTASTMAEAMEMVRAELGDDAIIVSTQRASGTKGILITAALEPADADSLVADILGEGPGARAAEIVSEALVRHGLPQRLIDRLVNVARTSGLTDPVKACSIAIEAGFAFARLPEHSAPRPLMMVGPPGSGKSIAVAKLAARAVLKRHDVSVITCDNVRAGATAQLAAFTNILEIDLLSARGAQSLANVVANSANMFDLTLIDSPGVNPFKTGDMEFLRELIEAADVEPVLVMAAGGDATEAGEMAEAFGQIGVSRLFASKLDTTRRLGAVMVAADVGGLALSDVSASPHVASGIAPISALSLAHLQIPAPVEPSQSVPPKPSAKDHPPMDPPPLDPLDEERPAFGPIHDPDLPPHWSDEVSIP